MTNQSYQVFYGKMNPFIVEIPDMDNMKKGVFSVFNYDMDSRRYHSRVDFATKRIVGFNKMTVYNETNSSGLMNLIPFLYGIMVKYIAPVMMGILFLQSTGLFSIFGGK